MKTLGETAFNEYVRQLPQAYRNQHSIPSSWEHLSVETRIIWQRVAVAVVTARCAPVQSSDIFFRSRPVVEGSAS